MAPSTSGTIQPLPTLYALFFLWIEPIATAVGAYYSHFDQAEYMRLTVPSNILPISTRESIVLTQLANLYFVFALNEALVLRATDDLRVWKVFLFGLLVADFGHLYSVHLLGWNIYWEFWTWNSIAWGNIGFVYVGASMRMAFLSGLGLGGKGRGKAKAR